MRELKKENSRTNCNQTQEKTQNSTNRAPNKQNKSFKLNWTLLKKNTVFNFDKMVNL